jgi:hypothetical protein
MMQQLALPGVAIPGIQVLPPGSEIELHSSELRKMSLHELVVLMQKLGISTADVEDRISSALSR